MRIVRVKAFGDLENLEIVDIPEPTPGKSEVLVRIKACGLNYADIMQRKGLYLGGPKPPYYCGLEAAGVVEEIGSEVTNLAVGSRVAMIAASGMFAERVAVKATDCLAIAENLSFMEAAAFPIHYLTAYHALTTVARAQRGETVLIHAAGGGFGTAAVQIAKILGLTVIGTASNHEKLQKVKQLGADVVASYEDFESVAPAKGLNIVLETIGGDIFRRSLAVLSPLGRLVLIGMSSQEVGTPDMVKLLFSSKAIMGFHLNAILKSRDLLQSSIDRLLSWLNQGMIKIQIGHTFPLTAIRPAQALMESRRNFGKVVLIP